MTARRSHNKFRRGCCTCKRRRVKCDESGPPCTDCKSRQTACEYASPDPLRRNVADGPLESRSRSVSRDKSRNSGYEGTASPDHRRTIEIQLLHRWWTVTFASMATQVANDWHVWQKTAPEMALKDDFLLNTIFALSAFEMAFSYPKEAPEYHSIALEYQGLAFCSFHTHLRSLVELRLAGPALHETKHALGHRCLPASTSKKHSQEDHFPKQHTWLHY